MICAIVFKLLSHDDRLVFRVFSSGMYLWGDFPHVTLATAWFEFVFYVICFWEAVFCMLMWWADFKQRDGADGAYTCHL